MPSAQDEPPRAPNKIADRYEVVGELGSGGAGIVYRVADLQCGTQVALKCLRADGSDSRLATLFRHEYHTLAQLSHPRIVSVYDYGVCEIGAYYTMELIDGLDVREAAPLPASEVCRLLRDVASALAMLHARRLLHRDVSYRNVRCTSSGHAKLIDFGAMIPIGTPSEVIGTPPFIPPESVHDSGLDPRADLYSLGALAYWMLTARHAYPANNLMGLRQLWASTPPPSPAQLAANVPADLDRLVMSLLCQDPKGRPASAGEVMDRLSAIADLPPAEDLRVAEAYLAKPALVGRKSELKRIREYVARDAEQRRPILIEGREGVGKTRLLEELVMQAKLSGAVTIHTAGESGHTERYAVARRITDALIAKLPHGVGDVSEEDRRTLGTEFPAFRAGGALAVHEIPAAELRHRLQVALVRWYRNATRSIYLVIAVDDFHLVDDESAAVLAGMIADGADPNLCLAVSVMSHQSNESAALRLLRQFASTIQVRPLREDEVGQLIGAVFGDVPNSGRVAHWMYTQTRGNPLECVELAHYLVERELAHYAEGTWTLPDALPREIPQGLQATRQARVAALPPSQRALAEAIAVFGVPIPLELCVDLADLDEATAFEALNALVRFDLLTVQRGDYAYRAEALRASVETNLSPERASYLHEKAGQLLLPRSASDRRLRARAAHHLMRGRSKRQGADLIAAIARDPNVERDIGEFYTAPLELALRIYQAEGVGPADTMPLRARLLNAAFLYDRNLVHYVVDMLPQLRRDAGLALMRSEDFERADWFTIMVQRATEQHAASTPAERGLPPMEALQMLSSVAGVTLAAAILKRDPQLIEQVWTVVAPLTRLGSTSGLAVAPELVGFYLRAMRVGDPSNHEERCAYIERLRDPRAYPGIPEPRRQSILATQLHNVGMATSVLDGDTALRLADEIDALGMRMYEGSAMQVRYMVYMYRGEADRARECRARIDVLSLQGGAGTQFELWLAPYLADPFALWNDVLGLKQAAAQLKRLGESDVGYAPMGLIASGHYDRVRGHYAKALAAFENARALAPRNEHASWLLALSGHMDTLVEAGEYAEAFEIGNDLLDSMNYGPRFTAIIEQRLACTMALAEAQLGRTEAALQRCARAIEVELAFGRSPLHLGRLHETLSRIAIVQRDAETFTQHVSQVRQYFTATRNPLLITQAERLAETGRVRLGLLDGVSAANADLRSVVEMIARIPDPQQRAQSALEVIQREIGITSAFLFLTRGSELELVAARGQQETPDGLNTVLTTLLHDMTRAVDRTTTLDSESPAGAETKTLTYAQREYIPLPLGFTIENTRTLVGVIALPVDQTAELTAPPWRLLEALAKTLYESGDVVLDD